MKTKVEIGKASKSGEAKIYVRVTEDRKRAYIPLDMHVHVEAFDKLKERIKSSAKYGVSKERASEMNMQIENTINRINVIYHSYRMREIALSADRIKELFYSFQSNSTLPDYIQKFIDSRRGVLKDSTLVSYRNLMVRVQAYSPSLSIHEVNEHYITSFERFLIRKYGVSANTIKKYLKVFKTVMHEAEREEVIAKSPFRYKAVGRITSTRTYLSIPEVKRLYDLYFSDTLEKHHQEHLRRFLFSCFTGIRISDSLKLNYSNIREGCVHYTPEKTERYGIKVAIPLPDIALKLIDTKQTRGLLFPFRTSQVINRSIKKTMRIARISKPIDYHTSRHTFATMYLSLGGTPRVLMGLMGLNKLETVMVYAHIVESQKVDEMELIDKAFQHGLRVITNSEAI